jgi:hypothetical protein
MSMPKDEAFGEVRTEPRPQIKDVRPRDKLEENFDLHPPFKTAGLTASENKDCSLNQPGRNLYDYS